MIANLVIFNKTKDLEQLTGLKRTELWNNDFDLDDWDIGFESDVDLYENEEDFWWLINSMEDYCVGPSCTKYKGKYYYLIHHA